VLGVLAASLISSKLRLEERHGALALWQLATPGSRLLVAIALMLVPALAGRFVALGFAFISLGVAALAAPQLWAMLRGEMRLQGHGPRPAAPAAGAPRDVDAPRAWSVWSQAWAFGLSAVLYPVFFQISTVLVKYFDGNVQAGIFGIALAVMTAIYLIPSTVFQKYLLSKQHRWAVHDPKKFWLVYRRGNVAMLVAGVVLGALVAVLARWAVPLAFGDKYQAVVPVLMVLAWCVPIRFMSTGVGSALLSERHMRYRVFAMGLSALVVIGLNVMLIPAHHEIGAAIATVVGESVLLLALYGGVRLFHPPGERAS
jgi:O-antigen/teichoic acid export membrane protein